MKKSKNYILYLAAVMIPAVISSLFYMNKLLDQNISDRQEAARWTAAIHQRHWDDFISETVSTLEVLSIAASAEMQDPAKISPLLQRIHLMDSRYGGLYVANAGGEVIAGSNSLFDNKSMLEKDYILEAMDAKDIVISSRQETLENGQKVIGLAAPVLKENREIAGIAIAQIRVDHIENILTMLTPDARLVVYNQEDAPIMSFNMAESDSFGKMQTVMIPIERLPWTIKTAVPDRDNAAIFKEAAGFIARLLIIFHIIFFLIKYIMLKRQAAEEKKKNELQKLELVGTLAASTAHEIRNPLTGIKGLVQLLSEKYTHSEDQYFFKVIDTEISRINEIVSEFLILGKPAAQKMEKINLKDSILDLIPLFESEASQANVQCTYHLPDQPAIAEGTQDQLKQVLLNLAKNAFEAMPDGGRLSISLHTGGKWHSIILEDTGSGIREEDLEKVFTPFFTSKDIGTGLGLVVCQRIIESFGGSISISSRLNEGTTAEILLPVKE
jgi:two-component system, sporulation sensor kinase D